MLSWYKKLGKIRTSFNAFVNGDFNEIYAKSGVFAFSRKSKNSEVLVCVNASNDDIELTYEKSMKNLLNGRKYKDKIIVKKGKSVIMINE